MNHTADNADFLATLLQDALYLGIKHAANGCKRKSSAQLIVMLVGRNGHFRYRNFHVESLNRAYGIPFTCAAKAQQAADFEAERAASSGARGQGVREPHLEGRAAKQVEKLDDAERVAQLKAFGFSQADAEAQVAKLRKEELARMNATPATPGK